MGALLTQVERLPGALKRSGCVMARDQTAGKSHATRQRQQDNGSDVGDCLPKKAWAGAYRVTSTANQANLVPKVRKYSPASSYHTTGMAAVTRGDRSWTRPASQPWSETRNKKYLAVSVEG